MIQSVKPGKYYVVDNFDGPCAGPFDTFDAAERERCELNIGDDCEVGLAYQSSPGKCRLRQITEATKAE